MTETRRRRVSVSDEEEENRSGDRAPVLQEIGAPSSQALLLTEYTPLPGLSLTSQDHAFCRLTRTCSQHVIGICTLILSLTAKCANHSPANHSPCRRQRGTYKRQLRLTTPRRSTLLSGRRGSGGVHRRDARMTARMTTPPSRLLARAPIPLQDVTLASIYCSASPGGLSPREFL